MAVSDTYVRARIDNTTKERATAALGAMGLVYNAAIGIPAARAADHIARLDRLAALVAERGRLTFDEVAQLLDVDRAQAVALAVEVRQSGRCSVEVDLRRGDLWWQPWSDAQCAALRDSLKARGRVEISAFAAGCEVPEVMVREWVYTLVYRRQLTGYVAWSEGLLYSADATALRASSRCPSCAGQLELVAQGVVACQQCDTQTLLS